MSTSMLPPPVRPSRSESSGFGLRSDLPRWRQRLVEAERGISQVFRRDGALLIHVFVMCAIVAAGVVLEMTAVEWTLIIFGGTAIIVAELAYHALRSATEQADFHDTATGRPRPWIRICIAAISIAIAGNSLAVLLILGRRVLMAFAS